MSKNNKAAKSNSKNNLTEIHATTKSLEAQSSVEPFTSKDVTTFLSEQSERKRATLQAKKQAKKRNSTSGPSQKFIKMATELRKKCSGYSPKKKQQLLDSFTKRIGRR